MCDSRKYPYHPPPPPRMVLPIRPPPNPSEFPFQRGHLQPPPPIFSFHGLNSPHLGIIDCVLHKINVSDLKTQFFIIFDLFVISYQAICVSYTGRACLIDYEQSLFSFLIVCPVHEAQKQRLINLWHLKKTLFYSITSNLNYSLK